MNILLFNSLLGRISVFFFCCLFLFACSAYGQYYPNYSIPVYQGARLLPMAWVGGLNNPQFSAADLNNDGVNDLVIFDRCGNKFLTFINDNKPDTVSYTYAPKYEINFPQVTDWALLLDYDHDNIPDLWAYVNAGVQVFNGYYNSQNQLCFYLHSSLVHYSSLLSGYPNVPISPVDIPAFIDIDNDGDIDILTWDEQGGYLQLYKNTSEETGNGTDSLSYILEDRCWGKFYEETDREAKDLFAPCQYKPQYHGLREEPKRHSGHATCALANNNVKKDLKDVIVGNFGFNDLVYLHNLGYQDSAICTYQDTTFPHLSAPALMNSWPGAFYLNLNNDSLNDIVVAHNQLISRGGGATDIANVWYYQNIGTRDSGIFVYKTDSLFTRDMIEVGEGSAPVFAKLDNDSLNDLIVANSVSYGTFSANPSQLAYYKNTGTTKIPVFTLVNKDYMHLSSLNATGLYPAFGDLDGDGDLDMVLGNTNGTLFYYENTAGAGKPAIFVLKDADYFKIDVGGYSTPQLVDVNKDGKLDLLVGQDIGTISYFQNKGTLTVPSFTQTPTKYQFGGVNVSTDFNFLGYSIPFLTHLYNANNFTLLVGCAGGTIYEYNNIENNLGGNFDRVDTAYASINTGGALTICGADLNGDGVPELAIGNYRGGVTIYDTARIHSLGTGINSVHYSSSTARIYPNPTSGKFTLEITDQNNARNPLIAITNILGQQVHFNISSTGNKNKFSIELSNCPPGLYFCTIYCNGQIITDKVIVGH